MACDFADLVQNGFCTRLVAPLQGSFGPRSCTSPAVSRLNIHPSNSFSERPVLWCEICVDLLSGPNRNSRSAIPVSIGALEPVEPKSAPAVMDEPTLSTEELFLVLYCTIDELYQEVAPDRVRTRPGPTVWR